MFVLLERRKVRRGAALREPRANLAQASADLELALAGFEPAAVGEVDDWPRTYRSTTPSACRWFGVSTTSVLFTSVGDSGGSLASPSSNGLPSTGDLEARLSLDQPERLTARHRRQQDVELGALRLQLA